MSDFVTLYPGVYTEREKTLVDRYLADNRALEERGEIDIQALIHNRLPKDTPGIGPNFLATEAMVRYNNQKYDPENPLLNDAQYARKRGYQNILAYPTFCDYDDFFMVPYPPAARDKLLVSQLNHSLTIYQPVYPDDTLYLVNNARHMTEMTSLEGSQYRFMVIRSEGSVYNQKGEKVNDVIFRVTEGLKIYKPGKEIKDPTFAQMWEAPDWTRRPAHYYTDDDWEFIKDLWSKEKRQGNQPLYWEDVNIGDEPTWTVDGPVDESVLPTFPYGMGTGGSRSMKQEILDPQIFKTMIRDARDGIYRLPNKKDYIPPVPDIKPVATADAKEEGAIDTRDIHKSAETRSALINYVGRDIAIRHIHNWMGDYGWLYNIRWGLMPPESHAAHGKIVPQNPDAERFLEKVPKMQGRFILTHGLTGDLAITRSCVIDKYPRDGQFFVELVWWVENIEGYIWEEGAAIVRLPSKTAK